MITTFFSEKGGSGKTTFNILYASYLTYVKQFNTLYIDTDHPNFHAEGVRLREINLYKEIDNQKNFRRYISGSNAFSIQKISDLRHPENFKKFTSLLQSLKEQKKYDKIIIDLPGTLDNLSVKDLLFKSDLIDHLYIPIEEDKQLIWSSVKLASALKSTGRMPLLFWNKIYVKEGIQSYDHRSEFIKEKYGLEILATRIKNSVKIRREWEGNNTDFIRSTLSYPLQNIKAANLNCITELFEEISNENK